MKSNQKGYTIVALLWIIIWVAAAIGWIHNIIDIVHAISAPVTGMFILRCIGIVVAPLGAVLGYL